MDITVDDFLEHAEQRQFIKQVKDTLCNVCSESELAELSGVVGDALPHIYDLIMVRSQGSQPVGMAFNRLVLDTLLLQPKIGEFTEALKGRIVVEIAKNFDMDSEVDRMIKEMEEERRREVESVAAASPSSSSVQTASQKKSAPFEVKFQSAEPPAKPAPFRPKIVENRPLVVSSPLSSIFGRGPANVPALPAPSKATPTAAAKLRATSSETSPHAKPRVPVASPKHVRESELADASQPVRKKTKKGVKQTRDQGSDQEDTTERRDAVEQTVSDPHKLRHPATWDKYVGRAVAAVCDTVDGVVLNTVRLLEVKANPSMPCGFHIAVQDILEHRDVGTLPQWNLPHTHVFPAFDPAVNDPNDVHAGCEVMSLAKDRDGDKTSVFYRGHTVKVSHTKGLALVHFVDGSKLAVPLTWMFPVSKFPDPALLDTMERL